MNIINFYKTLNTVCKKTGDCYYCLCSEMCHFNFFTATDDEIVASIEHLELLNIDIENPNADESIMTAVEWFKCVRETCRNLKENRLSCYDCPYTMVCTIPTGAIMEQLVPEDIELMTIKEKTK